MKCPPKGDLRRCQDEIEADTGWPKGGECDMRESRNDFRCRLLSLAGMLLALLFALTGCARSTEGPMYVAEFID